MRLKYTSRLQTVSKRYQGWRGVANKGTSPRACGWEAYLPQSFNRRSGARHQPLPYWQFLDRTPLHKLPYFGACSMRSQQFTAFHHSDSEYLAIYCARLLLFRFRHGAHYLCFFIPCRCSLPPLRRPFVRLLRHDVTTLPKSVAFLWNIGYNENLCSST